jgi:hypothetical protein
MTLSIVTLIITTPNYYGECHSFMLCSRITSILMGVVILGAVMLNVIMPNVLGRQNTHIKTFSIMALSIKTLFTTLSMNDTWHE